VVPLALRMRRGEFRFTDFVLALVAYSPYYAAGAGFILWHASRVVAP
jgi:hypothetical protein